MSTIKDHLIIPVRPALITGANLLTLGVVSVGAVTAAAIAGTVIAGTAAVKTVGKARSHQTRTRSQSPLRSTRSGLGTRSGSTPRRSTGGLAKAARNAVSSLSTPARKTVSSLTGSGTRKTGQTPRATGLKSTAARSLARRVSGLKPGRAAKWTRSQAAKTRSLLPSSQTTKRVSQTGWKKTRNWVQKNLMGRDVKKKRPINNSTKDIKPTVSLNLADKTLEGATLNPARIIPAHIPQVVSPNATHATSTPGGTMRFYAEKMNTEAAEYDAPGILEIIDYLDDNLYGALTNVAEAFDALSGTARNKWPFDDAIAQKINMISECLWSASSMARGIVPDIEEIHRDELKKLRNPDRPGMEKFDLAANGKA